MTRVEAPWSDDQVASLNGFQACGLHHPFTGTRGPNGEETILIATSAGWIEREGGPVVQTWAYDLMTDWSWKERVDRLKASFGLDIGDEDTEPGI